MAGLRYLERVTVNAASTDSTQPASSIIPPGLCIEYMECEADKKSTQLVDILVKHKSQTIIVYFMTCACVAYWRVVLPQLTALKGFSLITLYGKMKQGESTSLVCIPLKWCSSMHGCCRGGLDIPSVDCVVQYDLPQAPETFVHRVGRTARLGREGNAIVFLLPKEEEYIEFQVKRGVRMQERNCCADASDIVPQIQTAAKKDRDVMEKGVRTFVSFICAYKMHQCNYSLRWKKLELGKLAMGYGLLQLPLMPEVKHCLLSIEGFVPVEDINPEDVKYKSSPVAYEHVLLGTNFEKNNDRKTSKLGRKRRSNNLNPNQRKS